MTRFDVVSLNKNYDEYKDGKISKRSLEITIIRHVLRNTGLYHIRDTEPYSCKEFLSWLYPRIPKAIDRYKNKGSSFSAYIQAQFSHDYIEWRKNDREHKLTETVFWTEKAIEKKEVSKEVSWEWNARGNGHAGYGDRVYNMPRHSRNGYGVVAETEAVYGFEGEGESRKDDDKRSVLKHRALIQNKIIKIRNRKQVLILLLKAYFFMTDDMICRIAPSLRMEPNQISILIDELHDKRREKEYEYSELREKVHSQFYRCLAFEKRVLEASSDSARYELLAKYLRRSRSRLAKLRRKLAVCRIDATNHEVANVLGLSKGTVDANLHAIRKHYKSFLAACSGPSASVPLAPEPSADGTSAVL
jgi:hypothetical protein